jgi:hypothetical protein
MASYLSLLGDYIVISHSYTNLSKIESYQIDEDIQYDDYDATVIQRELRWSYDQDTWSAWIEFNLTNLENIDVANQDILYLQLKYTLTAGSPITINSIGTLITTTTPDPRDNFMPTPVNAYSVGNSRGTAFLNEFTFDPYATNLGLELQKNLSLNINKIFGHNAAYIRVTPQMRSLDVILKEYGIYESSKDYKCIKIMVPQNQFPDSKLNFNPFNIDYEEPFLVHIDKRYFESFFGRGIMPQKRDIIYLPITNRLYEVSSSYPHRDFMYKDLYYIVSLVKYADKANVIKDDAILQDIDQLSNSTEELFGIAVDNEIKKITNEQQFTIATRRSDKVRDYIDPNLQIEERDLLNYHTLISHYRYDLSASPLDSSGVVRTMVDYLVPVEWGTDAERAFTCWFLLKNPTSVVRNVTKIEEYGLQYIISTNADIGASIGDVITFSKADSAFSLWGTVIQKIASNKVRIAIEPEVKTYVDSNFTGWEFFVGVKVRKNLPNVYLDGSYTNKGIILQSHEGRFFLARIGTTDYNFVLPQKLELDTWYCLVFNYSAKYKQISLSILKRKWNPATNLPATIDMDVLYEYTYNDIPIVDVSHVYKYKLPASYMKTTNLRLMSVTIEPEKMQKFLNESIVADSNQSIIIDNAIPRIKLPYVGGHPNKLL